MAIKTTIAKTIAGVITLAATTISVGATPHANAYNSVQSNPTIGCLAGMLELHGRAVTGSYQGETVYSAFEIYRYTSTGWRHEETTKWTPLNVGPSRMAFNDLVRLKQSGTYYAAYEYIASWDGAQWNYDRALTSLMSNYAKFGNEFGSGYYARCS